MAFDGSIERLLGTDVAEPNRLPPGPLRLQDGLNPDYCFAGKWMGKGYGKGALVYQANATTYAGNLVTVSSGSGYAQIDDVNTVHNQEKVTFVCRGKYNALSTRDGLFGTPLDGGFGFNISYGGTTQYFMYYIGGFTNPFSPVYSPVAVGDYVNVVVVYDGAGAADADRLKVWVDGAKIALTFNGAVSSTLNIPSWQREIHVGGGNQDADTSIALYYQERVAFPDAFAQQISRDPYQLFKPAIPTFDLSLLTAAVAPSVADYTMAHKILNFGYMGRRY